MDSDFQFPLLIGGASHASDYIPQISHEIPFEAEKYLIANPSVLQNAVKELVKSGVRGVIAPTLSVSYAKLENLFCDETEIFELLHSQLLAITREAAGTSVAVGAVVPPTELTLKPYGDTSFEEICNIYFRHIRTLRDSGADFILLDEQTAMADIRAALLVCRQLSVPAFVVMRTDTEGDTVGGTGFFPVLVTAQALGAFSVGLYDTNIKSNRMLFKKASAFAEIPMLFACTDDTDTDTVKSVIHRGVAVILTGNRPELAKELFQNLTRDEICLPDEDGERGTFAAVEKEIFFLSDDTELTEPVPCDCNIEENLIDAEENSDGNTILVELNSPDDAMLLASFGGLARMPVIVRTNNITALKTALRCFQGRLLVDKNCDVDEGDLLHLVRKYGGILY